jgi:hypothetical protein
VSGKSGKPSVRERVRSACNTIMAYQEISICRLLLLNKSTNMVQRYDARFSADENLAILHRLFITCSNEFNG